MIYFTEILNLFNIRSYNDNLSNKRYIFWEAFSGIRFRFFKIKKLVKALCLFYKFFQEKSPCISVS